MTVTACLPLCLLCDELAACPACTPPLPCDSWDRLQPLNVPECRISCVSKWMDGQRSQKQISTKVYNKVNLI